MNKQRVLQALENVKSNPYGKWGILNIEQRRFIKELCNSWLILDDATNKQQEEIERLHSIIKEVREYIEKNTEEKKSWLNGIPDYTVFKGDAKELLEILDKANEKENK